jgi:hypothetical protein
LLSGTNATGTQHLADVPAPHRTLGEIAQQILGEQDADDLVAVVANHREARVARLDHGRQQLLRAGIALQHHHL